ncbi:hypothetical protein CR513_08104, partial [Mucuna pruriens]
MTAAGAYFLPYFYIQSPLVYVPGRLCLRLAGMILSSANLLYDFDPEIELTLHRLRKVKNTVVNTNSSLNTSFTSENSVFATNTTDSFDFSATNSFSSSNNSQQQELMENQDRTLKELATPDVVYQPWCIEYPQLEPAQSYELKSGLIHLLPKFHGLVGEDPYKHLKEFQQQQQQMMPPQNNVPSMEEWVKFQQNMIATMHDLKMQIGQLANSGGNVSVVLLRSGKGIHIAPRPKPTPIEAKTEKEVDSRVQQQARPIPLPFHSWTILAKKPETDEDLLKMFQQVEINIPLLDAIKQIPSFDTLYDLDPKIEITLRRLRKDRSIVVSKSSNSVSSSDNSSLVTNTSDSVEFSSANNFSEPEQMENNDRTLKELATPDVYPQLEPAQTYELKSGLIHLLPKFHGLAGEDPHKDLKEFHVPILFNTRGYMKHMFLEKFFPASRTATIKKEICGIRQHSGETLHEYWERFNMLCATCPHHQISKQLLIQYFYEGLTMMDRSMIVAASGGALMDKTPTVARYLISNMASNTQ